MRILNVEPEGFSPRARELLCSLGEVVDRSMSRGELLAELPYYDVLIVRFGHRIDREMIDAGRRLRAIVTAATGVDHIDVAYAQEKAILVLSLRGETKFLESVTASAEHSWALLLALMRRVPQAVTSVRNGVWNRDLFRGHDLQGKRLAIVGLGRVGRKIAAYARVFEMQTAAYDPYITEWPEHVRRCASLSELCDGAEILSIHVALTPATKQMVGHSQLNRLARSAVLVNTARGEVVDECALLDSLENGQLAGAAVDVVCGENNPGFATRSALLTYARTHDNLLITPHIGGATYESMAKTEIFVAQKLVATRSSW